MIMENNDLPSKIIIQELQRGSPEANAAVQVCISNDISYQFISDIIYEKDCLVIGSVEYIRKWFNSFGINKPHITSYPRKLRPFLRRKIDNIRWKDVDSKNQFIKPVIIKLFTPNDLTLQH